MREISSKLFEGNPGHPNVIMSLSALSQRVPEVCGRLVSWSVIHGGPGLPLGLSPVVCELMVDDMYAFEITDVIDVVNGPTKENIKKVHTNILKESNVYKLVCFCNVTGLSALSDS